jgi:hypothetical protein
MKGGLTLILIKQKPAELINDKKITGENTLLTFLIVSGELLIVFLTKNSLLIPNWQEIEDKLIWCH